MRDHMAQLNATAPRKGRSQLIIAGAAMLLASCGHQRPVQGQGNPPAPGPTQKIHLIWKGAGAPNPWMVKQGDNGPEEKPATAKTDIAKGVGPTKFEIDIQGASPPTFTDESQLSVWAGDKAHPQKGINSTQILGPVVVSDKKMVFWDLNQGDAVTLSYSIEFKGNPAVDPIINNGGGNTLQ